MGRILGIVIALLLALFFLGKCVGPKGGDQGNASEISEISNDRMGDTPKRGLDSSSIVYASDPNARFEILDNSRLPNGNIEVLNKRIGPSGISYSRREISCSEYTYRYLGEGDTLDEAKQDGANLGEMSALTGTSASSDVANEACKKEAK
jgi:hypothetical protein